LKIVLALVLVLVLGPKAVADTSWELRVPERIEIAAGASGTLPLAIAVDRGLSISKDAQLVIDIATEGAITVKRRRLGRGDAVDPDADEPRFAVPVHAETAGDYSLKLHVRFWVCAQKTCKPVDARRSVVVSVVRSDP
jgi:hypothetical protein